MSPTNKGDEREVLLKELRYLLGECSSEEFQTECSMEDLVRVTRVFYGALYAVEFKEIVPSLLRDIFTRVHAITREAEEVVEKHLNVQKVPRPLADVIQFRRKK
jgi:hypothetical protein